MKKIILSLLTVWMLVCAGLVGLFLFIPEEKISVSADTIIVDDDGTPGVDCNYTSIQDAIDNATEGDTILVYDGIYYENVIVNKTLTLIGNGSMNTIINGSGIDDVVNVTVNYVNLTGFYITYSGSNEFDAGIELNTVSNCNIYNNLYSNNTLAIYLNNSSSNNITLNSCLNNTEGIYINSSTNNNITNNSFSNNQVGINLSLSSFNFIYHNSFIDNTNQSYDDTSNGNQWDNGYPSGGNYWSDYGGVDLNWTPTQDVPSPDGIGDTPYNIDLDSKDNYPLMGPINEIVPRIFLISPANNSVIQPGVILDFNIYDQDLDNVNYSIDGGIDQVLGTPFDVSTSVWIDGGHSIQINACDLEGNSNSIWYFFSIDSIRPFITLDSPLNNSIITSGTPLNFSVIESNFWEANYSINGGPNIPITDPFDISTSGWTDGDYTIQINAEDEAGNLNSSWYFFTLDSTSPIIILSSPANNSIIQAESLLDFSIIENNLDQVNYSINGGLYIPLSDPFDISTSGWADGDYTVQINAQDEAGNSNSSWYFFTLDSAPPTIILNAPGNNSIIQAGTTLDFSIVEPNLDHANYSVNGGLNVSLSDPFDISTSGWTDGDYTVQINALDVAGNLTISWFFFTIDSTNPNIQLNSPLNNSVVPGNTILDFSVTDLHIIQVNYSINGGSNISITDPFDISTSGWSDGDYTIQINVQDEAGNSNSSWYFFSIDSNKPQIILNDPLNNSVHPSGLILDFSISDPNLSQVNYSINGEPNIPFIGPYDISTFGWTDGEYTILINATDMAGNLNSSWFFFYVDSTKPTIQLISPLNNSIISPGTLLDFSVSDSNLDYVNYSINEGFDTPLPDPFDLSTSGWTDGDYKVQINAEDEAGNSNSLWYFFTVDSAMPTIQLVSPLNNSIISAGTILDFSVQDTNLDFVVYSINGEPDISLSDPYDISTSGWTDGDYTVQINAQDAAGNTNSSWYFLTIDATSPTILLNSPGNNSIITSGTLLDFLVTDTDLLQTNYSINGGPNIPFTDPFDISTTGWAEGDYTITINAEDTVGNKNTRWFFFTVDSTKPTIQLNSPFNNSIIPSGTILDFLVSDSHLDQVNYSVNGGVDIILSVPYDISTAGWMDGDYTIQINVLDLAGNSNSSSYFFTMDSTLPQIILNSPGNNSVILEGTVLDFSIVDPHLSQVNYSINGGAETPFLDPYDISTVGWSDGEFVVQINTVDSAGNFNSSWYLFTIDSTIPMFILNSPDNNSVIPNGTILDFDIVESNLDQANYSVNGGLNISFSVPYNISTMGWIDGDYTIQVNAVDLAGNLNSSWYFFTLDSNMPTIVLNNPENNSIIPNSTILNFSIIDPHLTQVNYSINGGVDTLLTDPYDIFLSSLPDGDYNVQINTVDLAGNSNSSWYFFTIDSSLPIIIFEAPENNSIVQIGTNLNFSIVETHLMQVNYSINGGSDINISDPFDISTLGWADGGYTIQINAMDLAGNLNSSWYFITLDSTSPVIILNTPQNNSAIQNKTILDFSILDPNLLEVNYSINGGANTSLSDPFNISIAGWIDDNYTIQINALDMVGNSISAWYFFTIDSIGPEIILNTPENNSVIQDGTILDFSIIDPTPTQANYSINDGPDNIFSEPFQIQTSGWNDGGYTIQIIATDQAGNFNSKLFFFTIDSTPPTISIAPSLNHSIVSISEIIQLDISDPDTNTVMYSINEGEYTEIIPPYNISTSSLEDGRYTIHVKANDTLGNEAEIWFEIFVVDEPLISLVDEIGDVMNENEVQVGGHPDIDMINITIWKVGDYLLYEMSVDGIVQDQMVGSDVYFYGFSLFMDDTDDPKNIDDRDYTIHCGLGLVDIENEDTGDTQSLEAFGFESSILRILIPLSFIDDNTNFIIGAENIVYINFNAFLGTYDEAYLDTSLDATDLLLDTDNDGIPDDEDDDDDNDEYLDYEDDFPLDSTEWLDTDGDGIGNNADNDDDDDGHLDDEDDFPLDDTEWLDTDGDGTGDKLDADDDGDGYLDYIETSEGTDPLDPESKPPDNDGDLIPDSIDLDDDNDGVLDLEDDYPFDASKSKKSSEDGGFGLIILVIIIVVVIVLVVLLLFLKKRGKAPEEAPIPEEGAVAFGGLVPEEQAPIEGMGAFGIGEAVLSPVPESATYKCPHCEKPFTAPIYQQPMIAVCPSCGNKTTIGPQERKQEEQLT